MLFRLAAMAAAGVVALSAPAARAWGPAGHQIVAEIAQQHLTPAAKAGVHKLIGDATLASISTWADGVRKRSPWTFADKWHYVDIPYGQQKYDAARDCSSEKGECVVHGLTVYAAALASPTESLAHKRTALRFIVHFVGDIAQPMHADEWNDDGGGNADMVLANIVDMSGKMHHRTYNLHKLWDSGIIEWKRGAWEPYGALLASEAANEPLPPYDGKASVVAWAEDTHTYGEWAYNNLPGWQQAWAGCDNGPCQKKLTVDEPYFEEGAKIIDKQLIKASLRLAALLNASFQ